jgi:hypothetical protein
VQVAGEELRLKVFGIMRTSAHKALRELQVDALSPGGAERLLDEVIAIEKAMGSLKVMLADRATESGGWRARGARSPEEDLALRSGTSRSAARDTLVSSKRVQDQPVVADALRDGKLSERQAVLVTDAAAADPQSQSRLVDCAARNDLGGLRDTCGRVKAAADRDEDATNRRIHAERYLRYGKGTDGAVNGSFRLTPQAGAKLDAFLQPFIQAAARQARRDHRRDTLDQLSADGLVAMAEAAVHGPATKTSRPQVNVIVDRDALVRGHTDAEERCEFSTCFGPVPVPVSVVQEILDDAFLVGLFHDGVDVQGAIRFGRHTAAAVKDALRVRDDFTCSQEGCNRRARLELDHTEPVAAGGPTRYTNLKHLCWHHHQQKTRTDRATATAREAARDGPAP